MNNLKDTNILHELNLLAINCHAIAINQVVNLFEHFSSASSVTKSLNVDILLANGDHQLQIFLHFRRKFIPIEPINEDAQI